jgi:hypothetical protein
MRVVFDTSVLVAALRSRQGASYALVSSIPSPEFQLCLSVGLYAEWEDVLNPLRTFDVGQHGGGRAAISALPCQPGSSTGDPFSLETIFA